MADRKPTVLNPAGYQENLQDTDNLIVEAAPTADNHAVNKEFVDTELDDLKVIIDGDIADAGKWEESDGKLYPKNLTNKVGIGTDSPDRILHIRQGGGPSNCEVRIENTDGEGRNISLAGAGSQTRIIQATGKSDGNALAFYTGAREDVRFDVNGNVGIGTDSPAAILDVKTAGGSFQVDKFGSSSIYLTNPKASGTIGSVAEGGFRWFKDTATEWMRIASNGNVGIGTNSPDVTLELGTETPVLRLNGTSNGANVYGDIRSTGNGFEFLSRGGASSFGSYAFYNYNGTTESIALKIKSDGKVGIGTDAPVNQLHVVSTSNPLNTSAKFESSTNNSYINFVDASF